MDMMSYVDGKANGSVTLTKIGFQTYQLVARRFDPATAKETYPELVTLNRQNVAEAQKAAETELANATNRSAGVKQLIADLDALDAAPAV
mgnify:CR=1 FL=1